MNTTIDETIKEVVDQLQNFRLQLAERVNSYEQLQLALANRLNYLITNDFSLLISILYRLDISEEKVREFLSQKKELTASDIIAKLIIERQLQKIASRKAFKNNSTDITEEEKW
ncbi:hypothetical protein [Segetibacter sp.]|jgi:hypothetical protein|uniref:hypothetical protein n=1 Tax=Segetibacter sp. TaxID=2231182 RepID=UPI00262995DC|nr:hypothetical protein [Segetibacter sp.]MCW3081364.1 hypothetical protein [Segetibacter sp.]